MLRVMLREMLRQVLRWLLRSMPTDVLREMPTLVPTVVLRMLRTLLLRQVPTTVLTDLLTLLRTVHSQATTTAKDTTANNPRQAVAYVQAGRQMAMKRTPWKPCLRIDTYPAFLRSSWLLDAERNGGSKKIRGAHQMLSAEKSQRRRAKNHWPNQTLPVPGSVSIPNSSLYPVAWSSASCAPRGGMPAARRFCSCRSRSRSLRAVQFAVCCFCRCSIMGRRIFS
jgi:hypothetical protein